MPKRDKLHFLLKRVGFSSFVLWIFFPSSVDVRVRTLAATYAAVFWICHVWTHDLAGAATPTASVQPARNPSVVRSGSQIGPNSTSLPRLPIAGNNSARAHVVGPVPAGMCTTTSGLSSRRAGENEKVPVWRRGVGPSLGTSTPPRRHGRTARGGGAAACGVRASNAAPP